MPVPDEERKPSRHRRRASRHSAGTCAEFRSWHFSQHKTPSAGIAGSCLAFANPPLGSRRHRLPGGFSPSNSRESLGR